MGIAPQFSEETKTLRRLMSDGASISHDIHWLKKSKQRKYNKLDAIHILKYGIVVDLEVFFNHERFTIQGRVDNRPTQVIADIFEDHVKIKVITIIPR